MHRYKLKTFFLRIPKTARENYSILVVFDKFSEMPTCCCGHNSILAKAQLLPFAALVKCSNVENYGLVLSTPLSGSHSPWYTMATDEFKRSGIKLPEVITPF